MTRLPPSRWASADVSAGNSEDALARRSRPLTVYEKGGQARREERSLRSGNHTQARTPNNRPPLWGDVSTLFSTVEKTAVNRRKKSNREEQDVWKKDEDSQYQKRERNTFQERNQSKNGEHLNSMAEAGAWSSNVVWYSTAREDKGIHTPLEGGTMPQKISLYQRQKSERLGYRKT